MRKISLEVPETEKIDINGDIFEIRMSDADILNKCADLQKKYELLLNANNSKIAKKRKTNKTANTNNTDNIENIDAVKAAFNETIAFIDEILIPIDSVTKGQEYCGGGAVRKISKGRPVNMITACNWLIAVCREINKINDDYIKDKYE